METVWVKIIREKSTGRREIFRTKREHYVPEGWELDSVLETFTIGGPLPYGENNPLVKARREKEAKENRLVMAICITIGVGILLLVTSVFMSM